MARRSKWILVSKVSWLWILFFFFNINFLCCLKTCLYQKGVITVTVRDQIHESPIVVSSSIWKKKKNRLGNYMVLSTNWNKYQRILQNLIYSLWKIYNYLFIIIIIIIFMWLLTLENLLFNVFVLHSFLRAWYSKTLKKFPKIFAKISNNPRTSPPSMSAWTLVWYSIGKFYCLIK